MYCISVRVLGFLRRIRSATLLHWKTEYGNVLPFKIKLYVFSALRSK